MWLRLRYIVDRLRYRPSRARELLDLRCRLVAEPGPRDVDASERRVCAEMRELRQEIVRRLGTVTACARCAERAPYPEGPWPGGHCCGGQTEILFDTVELASLRAAGTRPGHLVAPRSLHAGCSFRGPRGCSLPPEHRPNRCVWYCCNALQRELHASGTLDDIEAAAKRLSELYETYSRRRADRLQQDFVDDLARHAGLRMPSE